MYIFLINSSAVARLGLYVNSIGTTLSIYHSINSIKTVQNYFLSSQFKLGTFPSFISVDNVF